MKNWFKRETNNYFCLSKEDKEQLIIIGDYHSIYDNFKYMSIKLLPCTGPDCASPAERDAYFHDTQVRMSYMQAYIDLNDFTEDPANYGLV